MTVQWVPRITIEQPVTVVPTVSTSPAYTANDQVGGVMTIAGVLRQDPNASVSGDRGAPNSAGQGYGTGMLTSITIKDQSLQSAAMDIFFFNSSPTVTSSDNAALNISDAEMDSKCIGAVSIGASYKTTSANSISTDNNINLPVWATSGTSIYAVAKTTGTPTYTATTALKFIFNFLVD